MADGISRGKWWATYRVKPSGALQRVKSKVLPLQSSREEAEIDLVVYAYNKLRGDLMRSKRGKINYMNGRCIFCDQQVPVGLIGPGGTFGICVECAQVAVKVLVDFYKDVQSKIDAKSEGKDVS